MHRMHEVLIRSLERHSRLSNEDVAEIYSWPCTTKDLEPNEDCIRQGDRAQVAVFVVSGMVARYHLLGSGRRQYLSFHLSGDLPDAQGMFLDRTDHALCAIGSTTVAFLPYKDILRSFTRQPNVGAAIWRETLLDAAIFRAAITNNSARPTQTRMAHLFCEIFYRSRLSGLNQDNKCPVPLSLVQLGEALAMGLATVNRALRQLRASGTMDFRNGELSIFKLREFELLADFDPDYLAAHRSILATA